MKKIIASMVASFAFTSVAFADGHAIDEFRIGLLGGENTQDRLNLSLIHI